MKEEIKEKTRIELDTDLILDNDDLLNEIIAFRCICRRCFCSVGNVLKWK